ncbi:Alpha/beta hydrolase fold-1 [Mycena amicta]|nr:Alpha/beta hydrolase fold-1 [Mycena amicta]
MSSFTVPPSAACPFSVQALRYDGNHGADGKWTLLFLHAVSLHKETFQPVVAHLLAHCSSIREVWSIENPNHGRSAHLNQELLETSHYKHYCMFASRIQSTAKTHFAAGSGLEYAQAVRSFLASTSHGVDFSTRQLVGLAHSGAVSSLMMLVDEREFKFDSLILLDSALLPPEFPSTRVLSQMFANFAASKVDRWPTRRAAHQYLAAHPAFKGWVPQALSLFVEYALHESGSEVVLSCTKEQEAAFYLSDDKKRPVDIFHHLTRTDQLPIHLITCLKDEYRGETLASKEFQMAQINAAARGSVQMLDHGGHMFPQVEPVLCAEAIRHALEAPRARL